MFPTEDRDGWYYIAEGICWVSTLIGESLIIPGLKMGGRSLAHN